MSKLLDANVLLALVHERHENNTLVRDWLDAQSDLSCGCCRVTQMALLRHLTNQHIMKADVLSQTAAWAAYDLMFSDSRFMWMEEPDTLEKQWRMLTQSPHPRHALWTDAYLAVFAIEGDHAMVSFDTDFRGFAGLNLELLTS